MANIQFGQIPQAQPIFAHPPAHADAAEDDPRCSHGKTADETCARCEHIADHLAPYEPSDDGIDDDGGYGGDFPGGILGTIMEGDSSDDDGGCMSARYNAAGTDETVAVTGKGSGRGGSRQGSGRVYSSLPPRWPPSCPQRQVANRLRQEGLAMASTLVSAPGVITTPPTKSLVKLAPKQVLMP